MSGYLKVQFEGVGTQKFLDAMGYDVVMLHFESLDCPYHLQISWG